MAQSISPVESTTPHPDPAAPAGTKLYTVASCTGPASAQPWIVRGGAIFKTTPAEAAEILAWSPVACRLATDEEVTAELARIAAAATTEADALTARRAALQARCDEEKLHA